MKKRREQFISQIRHVFSIISRFRSEESRGSYTGSILSMETHKVSLTDRDPVSEVQLNYCHFEIRN